MNYIGRYIIRVQKLEREEERKKKIAEKLAAGKIVGQNKREKGKTAYIEHYIGPNGEIDWNKSNVEKPIDYSKPTKVRSNAEFLKCKLKFLETEKTNSSEDNSRSICS